MAKVADAVHAQMIVMARCLPKLGEIRDYVPFDIYEDITAEYDSAWDAKYSYGCKCDDGFRGPDCSLIECPSTDDALGGDGNTKGRLLWSW